MIAPLRLAVFDELKLNFEKYVARAPRARVRLAHLRDLDPRTLKDRIDQGWLIPSYFTNLPKFLTSIYPHFPHPSRQLRSTKHFWDTPRNIRHHMENLASEIFPGECLLEDLLHLDTEVIRKGDGGGLLNRVGTLELLGMVFPEFLWDKVGRFPSGESGDRRRVFIDELVAGVGFVRTQEDMKEIDIHAVLEHRRGGTMMRTYGYSFANVWEETYPELVIHVTSSEGYWKQKISVERFLRHFPYIETRNNFKELTYKRICLFPGGASLLVIHNGAVQSLFVEHFPELPVRGAFEGYWKNKLKRNLLVQHLMVDYDLKSKEDWYRVSVNQYSHAYGKRICSANLMNLLKFWHPEEDWRRDRLSGKNKRARQRYLGLKLMELFQDEVVFEDYLVNVMDRVVIFDFYFPGLGLVIEYQGEQHYGDVLKWVSFQEQKVKDEDKRRICVEQGLKLVCVPFWWDGSLGELQKIFKEVPLKRKQHKQQDHPLI
eukprot:TRINITY_DN13941_c0_g1_i1.p1 TRINITY_DN13941_c0_g1~~TRINITY_DN13941_c0_g1_i1.p1  ORF type:complete len:486 (-),score=70.97 TRINITY_DN13941_c0_g1_i1:41-1498(-)